jgi:uncharacterized membrane protein
MEVVLALAALVLGAVAVWLSLQARGSVSAATESATRLQADLDAVRHDLAALRDELAEARRRLERLEEAPAAPPPLPRGRHAGLDDLRERLRAAHRESADEDAVSAEPAEE